MDLVKIKYQFADFILGQTMPLLGGVIMSCKQLVTLDPTAPPGIVDAANAVFNAARNLRATLQTKITTYDLAA